MAVGYPETTGNPGETPERVPTQYRRGQTEDLELVTPQQCFNALIIVAPDASVVAHYRKTHLYYTDATWAQPSPTGWQVAELPLRPAQSSPAHLSQSKIRAAFAICMDLNPQYFTAPWTAYEIANYVRNQQVPMLLTSMAWLGDELPYEDPNKPNMKTLAYWLERMKPLIEQTYRKAGSNEIQSHEGQDQMSSIDTSARHDLSGETLVIFANRTGIEPGECRACELDPVVRRAKGNPFPQKPALLIAGTEAEASALINEAIVDSVPGAEPVATKPGAASFSGPNGELKDDTGSSPMADSRAAFLASNPVVSTEARYAGTSTVVLLGGGKMRVLGILGRGSEQVLVVDTSSPPLAVYSFSHRDHDDEDHDVD